MHLAPLRQKKRIERQNKQKESTAPNHYEIANKLKDIYGKVSEPLLMRTLKLTHEGAKRLCNIINSEYD
jgi:hypothetical protein